VSARKRGAVEPEAMPTQPPMNMAGNSIDQCAKACEPERRPDPVFEEGRKLYDEAERAIRRVILHEATNPHGGYRLIGAVKALEALRNF
jgi:hypothetical protein